MASNIVAYLAISLDGYIADDDGVVTFLHDFGTEEYKFHDFIAGIGAAVMGATTYEQVLGFGWPYGNMPVLVLTHRDFDTPDGANVTFTSESTGTAIATFAEDMDKRVWIIGGGKVVTAALRAGIVDTLELYTMPVALGSGVPLFDGPYEGSLRLIESHAYSNGVVRLEYEV